MFKYRTAFTPLKNKRFLSYTKMESNNLPPKPPNPNFIIGLLISITLINERKK